MKELFRIASDGNWNSKSLSIDFLSTLIIQIDYNYFDHDLIYMKLDQENLDELYAKDKLMFDKPVIIFRYNGGKTQVIEKILIGRINR